MTKKELLARAEKAEKTLVYLEAKLKTAEHIIELQNESWATVGMMVMNKIKQVEAQIKELKQP